MSLFVDFKFKQKKVGLPQTHTNGNAEFYRFDK
jgi:hypothetical protein